MKSRAVSTLFAVSIALLARGTACAAVACAARCAQVARTCRLSTCAGLRGTSRRACRESCEGQAGCPALEGTLAYVVTGCQEDASGLIARQALQIQRGGCDPITVMELSTPVPVPDPVGLCTVYGAFRTGDASMATSAFERLGVTPDGGGVVFEVGSDLAVYPNIAVPEDQQGFYFVRSDGTGLRRLGPPSREAAFRFVFVPSSPIGGGPYEMPLLEFSPDGRTVTFTDLGPGPTGEQTVQVMTMDLASGSRKQLTHLPAGSSIAPVFPPTEYPGYVNARTISFMSFTNPDDLNPSGEGEFFYVGTDGTHLRPVPLASDAGSGDRIVPVFRTTRRGGVPLMQLLPDAPVNANPFVPGTIEIVMLNRGRTLQLTRFGRADTFVSFRQKESGRVLFQASADPLGTNPTNNCQFFSIDRLGGGLRQLTHFGPEAPSSIGCLPGPPPGCSFDFPASVFQDRATGSAIFESSCDPFGTNPFGSQVFAMAPDGSRLRQLTHARGFVTEGGTVEAELPGPVAYSPAR